MPNDDSSMRDDLPPFTIRLLNGAAFIDPPYIPSSVRSQNQSILREISRKVQQWRDENDSKKINTSNFRE